MLGEAGPAPKDVIAISRTFSAGRDGVLGFFLRAVPSLLVWQEVREFARLTSGVVQRAALRDGSGVAVVEESRPQSQLHCEEKYCPADLVRRWDVLIGHRMLVFFLKRL